MSDVCIFFFQKGVHMTEADATKFSKQMNSDTGLNKRKYRNTLYIMDIHNATNLSSRKLMREL